MIMREPNLMNERNDVLYKLCIVQSPIDMSCEVLRLQAYIANPKGRVLKGMIHNYMDFKGDNLIDGNKIIIR
jgi:hypothetical protein